MMKGNKVERPTSLHLTMKMETVQVPEIIDLCTPNVIVERFSNLQHRLSILPMYPSKENRNPTSLLLANVPRKCPFDDERVRELYFLSLKLTQLTEQELTRRRKNAFKLAFEIINHDLTIPSFLRDKYQVYFADLAERLQVDMTILDFNYTRLKQYMRLFIDEQIRVFNLRTYDSEVIEEREYPRALEFFLQFDGMFDDTLLIIMLSLWCLVQ